MVRNGKNTSGDHNLGQFKVKSGKLVVSDPCYKRGTWCAGVLENVANGTWNAEVTIQDEHSWGMRVSELRVYLASSGDPHAFEPVEFEIGVDAGQVCIVDEEVYPHGDPGEYQDLNTFYGRACEATDGALGADIIEDGRGVNSSSGYGDGSYAGYVARNKAGKIVAVRVVFIEEEDSEEIEEIEELEEDEE